jgi:formate-dependent nitrite reductase membrane component NrfD
MISREKYEWMVKYTPQTEWIERRGILLWLAFFFIEFGAGLYFISIFFNSQWGMLIGWLICLVLGGGTHLLYLGRPLRFYRAVLRPHTSWISRGIIFVFLFAAIGIVQLALLQWAPQISLLPLQVIMGVVSFVVVIYGGFAMNYVSALPIWNTALLPAIYAAVSLWGGAELLLGINLITNQDVAGAEFWARILMVAFAFFLILYLWSIGYRSIAASEAIRRMVRGDLALPFYLGVILIGLIYPFTVAGLSFTLGIGMLSPGLIVAAILCGAIGDLSMRYCILKGALYAPLIPMRAS